MIGAGGLSRFFYRIAVPFCKDQPVAFTKSYAETGDIVAFHVIIDRCVDAVHVRGADIGIVPDAGELDLIVDIITGEEFRRISLIVKIVKGILIEVGWNGVAGIP